MSALSSKRKSKDEDSQTSDMNTNKNLNLNKLCADKTDTTKRMRYTFQQKIEILDEAKLRPVNQICEKYKISDRALQNWKKERVEIEETAKNGKLKDSMKKSLVSEFDTELFKWFTQTISKGIPISGPILKQQALIVNRQTGGPANFRVSNGWLEKWKSRMNFKNIKVTGEKLSANEQAAKKFKSDFAITLSERNLSRKQVFNMDETGLQYKLTSTRTFVPTEETQASGPKKQLERVTIAGCSNADGSFALPLIVIGKSKNPRCLKNLKKETCLSVWYSNQKNAWMDQNIFGEWFTKQFVPKVESFLHAEGLPLTAILLVDNCKAHKYLKVRDIEIMLFPPNVTSLIQPMDQGILETLKIYYSNRLVESIIESVNDQMNLLDYLKTVNLYCVIIWISDSWEKVSPATTYKCWKNLWPVETREVATQTESCSEILVDLDGSVGTEVYSHPNIQINSSVDQLLTLIKSIDGYESVDSTMLLQWLTNNNCRDIQDESTLDLRSTVNEEVDLHQNLITTFSKEDIEDSGINNLITESINLIYEDI